MTQKKAAKLKKWPAQETISGAELAPVAAGIRINNASYIRSHRPGQKQLLKVPLTL